MAAPAMDIAVSRNGKRVLNVWFAILVIFLYTPLGLLLMFSFNDNNLPVFPLRGFTTQAYQDFAANTELRASSSRARRWPRSRACSPCCSACWRDRARAQTGGREVGRLRSLLSPLVVPYIALAIGLLVFFNEVSMPLGIPSLVMGHVVLAIPYTILVVVPRLERLDIRLEEAARDLGAGWFQTFRLITLRSSCRPWFPRTSWRSCSPSTRSWSPRSSTDTTTFPLYLLSQLRFPTLLPQVIAVACIVMAASCSSSSEPRSAAGSSSGASVPSSSRERGARRGAGSVHGPGEDDVAARLDTGLRPRSCDS